MLKGDGNRSFTKKQFTQKYNLCFLGLNPKQVRVPRYYTKEKFTKLFSRVVNKNGHHYMECGNPKLITNIENLWMIIHQKPYVLARKMITLGMAQGLVYELNGK